MAVRHYAKRIDTITEEIIKCYKTQCFNHLPSRLRRGDFVEVQSAIIVAVAQSMLQYVKNAALPAINPSEVAQKVCDSIMFHFKEVPNEV